MRILVRGCGHCGKKIVVSDAVDASFCNQRCGESFRSEQRKKRQTPTPKKVRFRFIAGPSRKGAKRKVRHLQRKSEHYLTDRQVRLRKLALEQKYGQSFYTTDAWIRLRYLVIKRDGKWCDECGRCGQTDGGEFHVDHIKPRSKFPKLEHDMNNLRVTCRECNLKKGSRYEEQ